MRSSHRRTRGPGFTLIEILVVVAIIALLIAILLPSLARARAQGRLASCRSNLHQHSLAANMWATEKRGLIPRGGDRAGTSWMSLTVRMLGDKRNYTGNSNLVPVEEFEVFQCPERSGTHPGKFLDYVVNALDHEGPKTPGTCAVNRHGGQWYEVKGKGKLDWWKRPAEVIYIMDAADETAPFTDPLLEDVRENIEAVRANPLSGGGLDVYDVWWGGAVPRDPKETSPAPISDADWLPRGAARLHLDRGPAAAFADGHVELIKQPEVNAATTSAERFAFWIKRFGYPDAFHDPNTQAYDPVTASGGAYDLSCGIGIDPLGKE